VATQEVAESAQGVPPQRSLAEGIALFDDGQYARAHGALKRALAMGLTDPRDTSEAYKYLAFYYCLHGVRRQCVRSFEKALQADPDQALNADESSNSEWLAAFDAARKNLEKNGVRRQDVDLRIRSDREARDQIKPKKNIAVLVFDIQPWGALHIDGKLRAVSPPDKRLWLPSGEHRIKIVNGRHDAAEAQYRLAGGEVYVLEYKFE